VIASVILFKRKIPITHDRVGYAGAHRLHMFKVREQKADAVLLGRMWPVNIGLGFGLGRSYGDCDRQFNPNSVPGWRLSKPSSSSTP